MRLLERRGLILATGRRADLRRSLGRERLTTARAKMRRLHRLLLVRWTLLMLEVRWRLVLRSRPLRVLLLLLLVHRRRRSSPSPRSLRRRRPEASASPRLHGHGRELWDFPPDLLDYPIHHGDASNGLLGVGAGVKVEVDPVGFGDSAVGWEGETDYGAEETVCCESREGQQTRRERGRTSRLTLRALTEVVSGKWRSRSHPSATEVVKVGDHVLLSSGPSVRDGTEELLVELLLLRRRLRSGRVVALLLLLLVG